MSTFEIVTLYNTYCSTIFVTGISVGIYNDK